MVASVVGVLGEDDGFVTEELVEVAIGPGGAGSFVAALADPGSTTGFESLALGLGMSAKALYRSMKSLVSNRASNCE